MGSISSSLDHGHTPPHCVADRGNVVGPPFDSDVSELVITILGVIERSAPTHFEHKDVAWAEQVRRPLNCSGGSDRVMREGAHRGARSDSGDTKTVTPGGHDTTNSRSMVPPSDIPNSDAAAQPSIADEIDMGETPAALYIDDGDARLITA